MAEEFLCLFFSILNNMKNVLQLKMVLMTEPELRQLMVEVAQKAVSEMAKNAHKLNDDCLLTIAETCSFMHITRSTLNKWTRENLISSMKKGGRVFYKKSELLAQKNAHYVQA